MTGRGRDNTRAQSSHKQCKEVEVEGLLNFTDWLLREATDSPSTSHRLQPQEPDSDSKLYEQVDTFEEEEEVDVLEEVEHYQNDEGE